MATSSAMFLASPIQTHQTPLMRSSSVAFRTTTAALRRRRSVAVKAEMLNPSVVISLSTGLSLFLGRFVIFNFQRENIAKYGLPEQNRKTHFEAGDVRAKEYVSLLKGSHSSEENSRKHEKRVWHI